MEINWKRALITLIIFFIIGFLINILLKRPVQEISNIMYWKMVGMWQTLAAIYICRKQNIT